MFELPGGMRAAVVICFLGLAAGPGRAETVFSDNFDSGPLTARWQDVNFSDSARGGIETRPQFVHSGAGALRLTSLNNNGEASGSQVIHWFMPGYEQLYFRWYAMFAGDFDQGDLMHWCGITGNRTDKQWSAFGTAGRRPDGTDFFYTNLETWRDWGRYPPPGAMNLYSYFPEMKADRDGVHYWGNQFKPDSAFVIQRGRWYCFEAMVKLNDPGQHNGEQAFWMDGRESLRVTGMRWRDSLILKLNAFVMSVYIHQAKRDNTCWFDDLVISTEYVGPQAGPQTPSGHK